MKHIIYTLMVAIITCCIIQSSVMPQAITDSQDSLRVEVQNLIDNAGEIFDPKSESAIDSAQICMDSALSIAEQNFGFNDTITAIAYYNMSKFRFSTLEYDLSIEFALKALDALKESPGRINIIALDSYQYLVENCLHKHDLVSCEQFCDQRLNVLRSLSEPLTPQEKWQMADALGDRARLLVLQNRYDDAIKYMEDGLSVITDELEEWAQLRLDLKVNIGWILLSQNKLEECDSILIDVLELAKHVYHPKHRIVLYAINHLGISARKQHDYERADSLMDIELALSEEIYGKSHSWQTGLFINKSYLLLAQNRPEEAVEFAMRAVTVNKNSTGDYPTDYLMGSLRNAGNVTMVAGNWELANEMFKEFLSRKYAFLNTVFGYASETQKLNYIAKYPPIINTLLSGTIKSQGEILNQTAMNMVLRGKGMAIDAIASEHAAAICSSDPFLDSLIEEWQNTCKKIADVFLSSRSNDEDIAHMLNQLDSTKNDIEKEISLNCSGMQLDYSNNDVSVETVAGKMPEQSVLWEFIKYNRVNLERLYEYDTTVNQSYLAIVLTPDTDITVIDLGDALTIDSLIVQYQETMSEALKKHLNDNLSALTGRYLETAGDLYEHIVAPLEADLQSTQTIFVAADGLLNLLPFETLTKDGARFLIEDHQFVYLTSGRDILREKPDLSGREALVIADPDFMIDTEELPTLASAGFPSSYAFRGNPTPAECLESMFSPLPMTGQEGMSVAALLKESGQYDITYLDSNLARENALKNLSQPPEILHIATHGYFCQPDTNSQLSNPLLRSGLILAGANRTIGGMNDHEYTAEDGILTAMEVSGMNLIGTDLVILSACQTGMGDVRSGEGVFGLRRAFQHAGAKSIIMSMFAVPDESTSTLMERFYENWLTGQSKASALRNASLSILTERRNKNESTIALFWSGFVLAGNPD